MTVDTTTGEIVETIGSTEARRLTTEAQNELRSSRDHFEKAWSLIEQAVKGGGHLDLGYRSPGDYLHTEFDGALAGLDVAARKVAVRAMANWGLSTRAIAPVVGANQSTVARDLSPRDADASPAPQSPESVDGGEAVTDSGQTLATADGVIIAETQHVDIEPRAVVGIDGKTYTRPAPTPKRANTDLPEWSDQDRAEELAQNLAGHVSALWALTVPERRAEFIHMWELGTRDSFVLGAEYVTANRLRSLSAALLTFADEWEKKHE